MTEGFFSQVRLRPEGFQALAAGQFQKIMHEFLVAHRRIGWRFNLGIFSAPVLGIFSEFLRL